MRTYVLTQTAFGEAAAMWLETRKPYISERTYYDYKNYIITLSLFFGELKLTEISADDIRRYQRFRMQRAGASLINHECSVLQQMLKRIGIWADLAPNFQPLPLPKESPHRALTPAEEERLLRIGATKPQWEVAYCAFVISINTTAGPGEIRHIRLRDVELDHPDGPQFSVQPKGAKNEGRIRVLPLNEPAARAMQYLLDRAAKLGSTQPDDYMLPFRVRTGFYDPTRPCKDWKYALRELLATAGIKGSAYMFRHHAITKLLENPDVSEETAEALAGHISQRMKKRYSHTRMHVKRAAVEALQKIAPKSVKDVSSWKQAK
jgi:integrase